MKPLCLILLRRCYGIMIMAPLALAVMPAWGSVNPPSAFIITLHYTMTDNTCDLTSATPTAWVNGSSINQINSGQAAFEEVEVQLKDCTIGATMNQPVIRFVADPDQYQDMALVDKNGTGAGFLLFQDPYGQTSINPYGGVTSATQQNGTTATVPFWVQLTKVGTTLTPGLVKAEATIQVDYN